LAYINYYYYYCL